MKKILFLHGLFHSGRRYRQLKDDLQGYEGFTMNLPGFGNQPYQGELDSLESNHVSFLNKIIIQGDFDYVVAHSWGCRVLLQCKLPPKTICILLNPAYGKNSKLRFLSNKEKIISTCFEMGKTLPRELTDFPTKLASLPSVNHLAQMDEILLADIHASNSNVSSKIVEILSTTEFRTNRDQFPNKSYLIYSKKDRLIPLACFLDCQKDLAPVTSVFPEVGHTIVLEDYSGLLSKIQGILRQEDSLERWDCCTFFQENRKSGTPDVL